MATLHITADKRLRCHAPTLKLPTATSFIRKTLFVIDRIFQPFSFDLASNVVITAQNK